MKGFNPACFQHMLMIFGFTGRILLRLTQRMTPQEIIKPHSTKNAFAPSEALLWNMFSIIGVEAMYAPMLTAIGMSIDTIL